MLLSVIEVYDLMNIIKSLKCNQFAVLMIFLNA